MKISTFEIEKELLEQGYDFVIGTDEVGRGPLAGPVVAAAVVLRNFQFPISNLPRRQAGFQTITNDQNSNNQTGIQNAKYNIRNTELWDLVRDSKKLSEKQREKVFDFIYKHFHVGVGLCNHETIDRINILEASFLAMKKAIQDLSRNLKPETQNENGFKFQDSRFVILVDGNKKIPNFTHDQKPVIGGDGLSKSIAAASIVAKVIRDRLMMKMHQEYPNYGFDKHKGYGTKLHLNMLSQYGPCEIHRKSFDPVKKLLK